jgi:5'-3' exonuclease
MTKSNILKELKGCNDMFETKDIDNLEGVKTFAVDMSNMVYKNSTHMYTNIIKLIKIFMDLKYTLIFVFDGNPPKEKRNIIKKRKSRREKCRKLCKEEESKLDYLKKTIITESSKEKIEELKKKISATNLNIKKYNKGSFKINRNHIKYLKDLLDYLKIKYIHFEEGEADLICSTLVKMGIADAYLGDDYDPLAYGCTCIVRNLNIKKGTVDIINLNNIYNKLKLSYKEFLYLIILNGTEYSKKIQGNIIYKSNFNNVNINDGLTLITYCDKSTAFVTYESFNTIICSVPKTILKSENITINNKTYSITQSGTTITLDTPVTTTYNSYEINLTYIHSLLISKINIDEILKKINNIKYDYKTAYDIFTKHVDIVPNKHIANYNESLHIDEIDKRSKEFLVYLDNPYVCLSNNI